MIQDNALRPLLRISVPNPQDPASREAGIRKGRQVSESTCLNGFSSRYGRLTSSSPSVQLIGLYTGIIRGALAILGLHAVVSADYNGGTQCKSISQVQASLIADNMSSLQASST